MRVSVIGTGYVGLVTGIALAHIGHKVTCVDINNDKIEKLKKGISPIYEPLLEEYMLKNRDKINYTTSYKMACANSDVIIISVGTPENKDGSVNLDYVYVVCEQIAKSLEKNCVVVVKSTVPIGTNDEIEKKLNNTVKSGVKVYVVSNPEFLSQGTAIHDTLYASRIIVGTEDEYASNVMRKLYSPLTKEPYNVPYLQISRRSAEMVKYASNNFLALKISYINEIANLCKLLGANIEDVVNGMGLDSRINSSFLKAGIGYGGSCFPKDTKALHWMGVVNGIELKTIKSCIEVNDDQKIILFNQLKKDLADLHNKTIAVLGLTFKPKTDDLRDAPSIVNIINLLNSGANVKLYDPVGINNFKENLIKYGINTGENIRYYDCIDEAIKNSDAVMIMTEWPEIVNYDVSKYKKIMRVPRIYDGRNCYSLEIVSKYAISYTSIGRPTINNLEKDDYEMLKSEVLELFKKKISSYIPFDDNDKRKYFHTLEVAEFAYIIASKNDFNIKSLMAMYIISIFHDLGRFFENHYFNKLNDNNKIDHARQSISDLFNDNEILEIIKRYKLEDYNNIIIETILFHNKLVFPNDNIFLKILMDADKLSILHLVGKGEIISLDIIKPFSRKCLLSFKEHKLINIKDISSNSDSLLKYLAFIFNFNYNESLSILKDNGYIELIFKNIKYKLNNDDLNCIKNNIFDYLLSIDLKEV